MTFFSLSYLCASPLHLVGVFGVEAEVRQAAGPSFRTASAGSAKGSGRPFGDSAELFMDVTWLFAVGVAWLGLSVAGWRPGGWMELAGPKRSLVGLAGPTGDLSE
jgi:hypothetical protein